MSFFSIARKNIKRNFNNYITYCISTISAVMIYYIFSSIYYNKELMEANNFLLKLKPAFFTSAIVVAIFSAVFVWYSNSFFIKNRKKEIATYSLLGMEKKQIARMLFYENMIMGAISLVFGILLGIMFSKFFTMILISLIGDSSPVKFTIATEPVIKTIEAFIVIFLFSSIKGYSLIYRFKLIELFNAQKEGEGVPKASLTASIISLLMIGLGYFLALFDKSRMIVPTVIPIVLLTVSGTYILFNNLMVIVVKLAKKNKKYYYKGVNLMSISQIVYRIKGNARTLATIAVLAAVTITAVGTTSVSYRIIDELSAENYPYDFSYIDVNEDVNKSVEDILKGSKELGEVNINRLKLIEGKNHLIDIRNGDVGSYIISESQHNKAVKHFKNIKPIELKDADDCIMLSINFEWYTNGKKPENAVALVSAGDISKKLNVKDIFNYRIVDIYNNAETIVVKDSVYNEILNKNKDNVFNYRGYVVENTKAADKVTDKIKAVVPKEQNLGCYYEVYKDARKISGVILFIGAFIGILFILATGSIIYFKQLMEANDDKDRYKVLRNIGASEADIKKSISKQIFFIFAMPLIIGICHSSAALISVKNIFNRNIFSHCILITAIYVFIYTIYYFVTVNSYIKILKRQ